MNNHVQQPVANFHIESADTALPYAFWQQQNQTRQEGAVLLTSLILLAIVTIIGAYIFSSGLLQERMATNTQLVALNQNAAQSSVDAYAQEGGTVFGGSLNHSGNITLNVVRRTIELSPAPPVPFVKQAASAFKACVNNSGTIAKTAEGTSTLACDDVDFQNTTGAASPIIGLSHAYYASCAPTDCGPGMASSLGVGSTLGCPILYVEGSGWLDVDGNGVPTQNIAGEEALFYIDEWLRWQRPTLCVFN
ncbi:hypothetical protein OLMES_0829 [Oleiphilus messinensis]|uniref:Type 4 fimbrial biogenesis protein PilX N-terminal domain-containing protein n=1 Tax=Oleiphilus messinensis TaxID=141451 RepID=A0A1Y0I3D8_9GAMM|nr:PilX N-terminal domain-containing pilus assembly protein [Oleiphilus messinensis]ARU54921.1 hypothetical protein OLMES_0829 [Oleiphilus messinensis]